MTKVNLATGSNQHPAHTYELREADARLIAAAPKLLSACEDMLRYINAGPIKTRADRRWCDTLLSAVIAEAKGQQ